MKQDDYISIEILKSDYYRIKTAFDYAISYHKTQAESFKRSTKVESVSKTIAEQLEKTYKRIYE